MLNKKIIKICVFNKNTPKNKIITGNGDEILDSICTFADVDENFDTGEYYLDANFIVDEFGKHTYLQEESILKVQTDYGNEYFEIASLRKTSREVVVFARQITISETLDMWLEDVRPENQSGQSTLNWIRDNSKGKKDIRVFSDIDITSSAYYMNMSMYKALHDCDQSFTNRWGGEIQRRGYDLTINKKIGKHRGVQIRSRKNLTGFEANTNIDTIVTRIKPVGYGGITIPGYVDSPLISKYRKIKTREIKYDDVKVKDPDKKEDEGFNTLEEAQQELIRRAELEFSQNHIDEIKADYRVNFVQLEQTEEYKDYVQSERVFLGDEIDVYEENHDINLTVRAVRRKFDVLKQRVKEIELSNAVKKDKPPTISDVINGLDKIENEITENNKWYKDAINDATDLIQNGLKDSYVVVRKNEILIMDTKDINTAVNVWRWNKGGLAHSSTGYYGDYDTAITQDGSIIGKFITGLIIKGEQIDAKNLRLINNEGIATIEVSSAGNITLRPTIFELNSSATTNVPTKSDVANEIKTAKTELDKSIKGVSDNVVNLKKDTEEALKDNTLTDNEKRTIKANLKPLATEFAEIQKDYDAKYKNTHLTGTPKTNLKNAYDSYVLKYNNLITSINALLKLTTITEANKTTLDLAYTEHDTMLATYRTRAEEAINNIAQNKSNAAKTGAEGTAKTYTDAQIKVVEGKITSKVDQATYDKNNNQVSQKFSQMTQTIDRFEYKFEHNGYDNLIINGNLANGLNHWSTWGKCSLTKISDYVQVTASQSVETGQIGVITSDFNVVANKKYSISFYYGSHWNVNVLNYNYLMKQGGNVRLNLSWTTNTDNLNYYTATFTPNFTGNCKFMFGFNGKLESNLTGFKISKVCIVEGDTPREFIPSSRELVEGITVIDNQGIKISHEGGSFSRMDPREFYQANENGDRTMSMRFGGLRTYQFNRNNNKASKYLGGISATVKTDQDLYGQNFFGSSQCGYLDLGFSDSSEDNQHKSLHPWLRCTHYDGNYELKQGIYAYKPLFIRHDLRIWHNSRPEVPSIIYPSSNTGLDINIFGNDGIDMGIAYGTQYKVGLRIDETTSEPYITHLHWGNHNFNGYSLHNANIIRSLNARSYQLRSKINSESSIENEMYNNYSFSNGEVRYCDRKEYSITEDSEGNKTLMIEIPQILAENIELDYHVNISKLSWGDYRIVEKNPYYFIIETNAEGNFRFTFEVVAKLIEEGQIFTTKLGNEMYSMPNEKDEYIEEEEEEIACSKYALLGDEEIAELNLIEELKENNELWKLYQR